MKSKQEESLTPRQKQEYEQNGFFIVRNLLPAPVLNALSERLDQAALGKLSPAIGVQVEPALLQSGETTAHPLDRVRKVWNLASNDPFFHTFVSQDCIVERMRELLGSDLRYFGDEAQLKPPFHGSAHAWHQDAPYFHSEPFEVASLWIAVDRATQANGCLEVLPGSHKRGILPRQKPQAWFEEGEIDTSQAIPVCLEPGDGLVFHALLIHGSGPNRTTQRRRSMIPRYVNVEALSEEQARVVVKYGHLVDDPNSHPIFRADFAGSSPHG